MNTDVIVIDLFNVVMWILIAIISILFIYSIGIVVVGTFKDAVRTIVEK